MKLTNRPKYIRLFVIGYLILGLICVHLEFKSIKPNLFLEELLSISLLVLFVIVIIFQIINDVINYKRIHRVITFLPSFILIGLLFIILIHRHQYSEEGFGTTKFTAYTNEINHGVALDFKTNGNLKIVQYYKFGETKYWGKYSYSGDTLLFDIETDFKLGTKALIKEDTLRFVNDTAFFVVEYP